MFYGIKSSAFLLHETKNWDRLGDWRRRVGAEGEQGDAPPPAPG